MGASLIGQNYQQCNVCSVPAKIAHTASKCEQANITATHHHVVTTLSSSTRKSSCCARNALKASVAVWMIGSPGPLKLVLSTAGTPRRPISNTILANGLVSLGSIAWGLVVPSTCATAGNNRRPTSVIAAAPSRPWQCRPGLSSPRPPRSTLVRRTRTTTKRRPDGGKKSRRTTEVVCPGPAPSPPSRPRPRPLPPGSKAIGDRGPRPLGAGRNL